MATQVGVTLVKRFSYRNDATEEFSNTYHFSGAVPADSAAWKALADALILQEKTLYAGASVVRAYGYDSDADNAHAVWSWDYLAQGTSVAGTLVATGGAQMPGDCAVWVRWKTNRFTLKGKPIFLRKYFHPAFTSSGGGDNILTAQKTALTAFGTKLMDGSFLDARTLTARGHTDTLLSSTASTFVTTRTLKRRGKRPGS